MNKAELIAAASAQSNLSKATVGAALDGLLKSLESALAAGEVVGLTGFGSFSVQNRKARVGRNPQTGREVKIPATRSPKFTAGARLKVAVNR